MKKQSWTIKIMSTYTAQRNIGAPAGTFHPVECWQDPFTTKGTPLQARSQALMELGIIAHNTWKEGHQLISAWVELTGPIGAAECKTETLQFHSTPKK